MPLFGQRRMLRCVQVMCCAVPCRACLGHLMLAKISYKKKLLNLYILLRLIFVISFSKLILFSKVKLLTHSFIFIKYN